VPGRELLAFVFKKTKENQKPGIKGTGYMGVKNLRRGKAEGKKFTTPKKTQNNI